MNIINHRTPFYEPETFDTWNRNDAEENGEVLVASVLNETVLHKSAAGGKVLLPPRMGTLKNEKVTGSAAIAE